MPSQSCNPAILQSCNSPLGLYLHIPFCSAICNYCNFTRGLFDPALKVRYVDALAAEIRRAGEAGGTGGAARHADTVYFGGGTPSLLEPEDVRRLIASCGEAFDLAGGCEVTFEANPDSVSEDRLRAYRLGGVNRLSLGVQSFRDEELRRLSRVHGADRARAAYEEARRAGFDNISLDLMLWLPAQSVPDSLESVSSAIALGPEHLSIYLLEIYPNAPLADLMARAGWSQAPDDDAAEMYERALERLDAAGYEQYEISNVARPGRRSRHNLKYWQDGEWLGFGAGAHSTCGGVRWRNVSSTEDYVRRVAGGGPAAVEVRRLAEHERAGDALFTGLRLTEGLDVGEIGARYGVDVWNRYGSDLERFVAAGLLLCAPGRLRLTRRGMLLANEVMAVFV